MASLFIQNAMLILKAEGWSLGLGFLSSVLLYLTYFPANLGFLGWIALVPLLYVVRSGIQFKMKVLAIFFSGFCFFIPALQWMRLADPMMYFTWIGLAIYCNLFFLLGMILVQKLEKVPLLFSFPLIWVGVEYIRSTFAGGFSWYLLAHSQHDYSTIIQICDLFGAYGVSFVVASVNGFIVEAYLNFKNKRIKAWAIYILLMLLFALTYGSFRNSEGIGTPGPICASLQGSVDQSIRNDQANSQNAVMPYNQLSDLSIASNPDLIIWPETSYMHEWYSISPKVKLEQIPPNWYRTTTLQKGMSEEVKKRWNTSVLLGLNSKELTPSGIKRYNSALLVSNGVNKFSRYDKIHRVPFGEFIPFKGIFPWLKNLAPYDFEYSIESGEGYPKIEFPAGNDKTYSFGTLICYEDTDSAIPAGFFRSGTGPNFFINISNDGWFKGSEEHEQHLAIARFRAIETRRSLIRSVNMGISALIDSNGKVLKPESVEPTNRANTFVWKINYPSLKSKALPVSEWHQFKAVEGILIASVPIDDRFSLYAKTGDILPLACLFVVILIYFRIRKPV